MYSPLHEKLAAILGKEKYAITSCLSKRVYLPTFKQFLAVNLIKSIPKSAAKKHQNKISLLKTYHHAYVRKIEKRDLNDEELNYMARFYIALKDFIVKKRISVVILHNDARWYHTIAIEICKELNVKYLVTEQGYIRPYTTIIDPQGVNANSRIDFNFKNNVSLESEKNFITFQPRDRHESLRSMMFFSIFLMGFAFERFNGSGTIIRYMHNNYSFKKYFKRIVNKFIKKRNNLKTPLPDSILLLLQLESDSQFLLHSPFNSNQEVIDFVDEFAKSNNMKVAVKLHPLDEKKYDLSQNSYYVDGRVPELATHSEVVFTINSSASVDVLKTTTPLVLMGESIYAHKGVAVKLNHSHPCWMMLYQEMSVDFDIREKFINYLHHEYLIKGAGYSFCSKYLKLKLGPILS